MKPTVCLFDLNGTLLDLSVLDPHFLAAFGPTVGGADGARPVWFSQVVELMLTDTALGRYTPFAALAEAALEMTAARHGVSLHSGPASEILAGMQRLPAFADVPEVLGQLKKSGLRLSALTQSALKTAQAQVDHAKLSPFFEQVFSADTVQQLKPGPRPYLHALETLGVSPAEAVLVAAHAWDIAGAQAAGLHTVFLRRPGQAFSAAAPPPAITADTLGEAAQKMAAKNWP